MSAENGTLMWAEQGSATKIYRPTFDYAMTTQAPQVWVFEDSADDLHAYAPQAQLHRHRQAGPAQQPAYQMVLSPQPTTSLYPSIKVISYVPSGGPPGSRVTIHVKSTSNLRILSSLRFAIMFYKKRCDASIKQVAHNQEEYRYTLTTDSPNLDVRGTYSMQVAVTDLAGTTIDILDVGKFTFRPPRADKSASGAKRTTKRKNAELQEELVPPPAKKAARAAEEDSTNCALQIWSDRHPTVPYQQMTELDHANTSAFYHNSIAAWQPSAFVDLDTIPTTLLSPGSDLNHGPIMQHTPLQHYAQTSEYSHALSASPAVTMCGAAETPDNYSISSPRSCSGLPPSTTNSPCQEAPPLIRTSQMPSQQPFTGYGDSLGLVPPPNTAHCSLRVAGSLNSMQENWTDEEKSTSRRLVEFERSQSGSVITLTFKSVPLDSRSNTNICVSCIWWKERKEAYITSVDTIKLLEYLVASRFNVQEKNRIRRNLEGFRPLTVAKGRADSDAFFKIIMGYNDPKPRVIEKDIKVFSWKQLQRMLKKVVEKYSADYASSPAVEALLPTVLTMSSASGREAWLEDQAHSPRASTHRIDDNAIPRYCSSSYSCFDDTQAGYQDPYVDFSLRQYTDYYGVPSFQPEDTFHNASSFVEQSWNGAYISSTEVSAASTTQPNIPAISFSQRHQLQEEGQQTHVPTAWNSI